MKPSCTTMGWNLKTLRGRHIRKTFNNIKVTLLCGIVTILVLRGTIGSTWGRGSSQEHHEHSNNGEHKRSLSQVLDNNEAVLEEDEADTEYDTSKPYSLGPPVKDWDQQRHAWQQENRHPAVSAAGKPRILLVTGSQPKPCDNPVGDHYLLKSFKNKVDYCRLHGIDIFYNMALLDHEMAGFWAKLPLIRKLMLAHPELEWIWWMDSDAMFTDMLFEFPIHKYNDYNFVLHGWEDLVYNRKSWIGLNTGSFLLRNNQWSLHLLDIWAPMRPKGQVRMEAGKLLTQTLEGRPDFEADDQSALIYLLVTQKARLGPKVLLESSYYLHGSWVILVDKFEEMMQKNHPGSGDDLWPFVTHFVGCKPCGSYGDYSVDRCLKQMERAFNFADNQVVYGFQHLSLNTPKVKRTRNETPHAIPTSHHHRQLPILLTSITTS